MTDFPVCELCGKAEREPFTPAAFSMLLTCKDCDREHCTDCRGDCDYEQVGDDYRGWQRCKECSNG